MFQNICMYFACFILKANIYIALKIAIQALNFWMCVCVGYISLKCELCMNMELRAKAINIRLLWNDCSHFDRMTAQFLFCIYLRLQFDASFKFKFYWHFSIWIDCAQFSMLVNGANFNQKSTTFIISQEQFISFLLIFLNSSLALNIIFPLKSIFFFCIFNNSFIF